MRAAYTITLLCTLGLLAGCGGDDCGPSPCGACPLGLRNVDICEDGSWDCTCVAIDAGEGEGMDGGRIDAGAVDGGGVDSSAPVDAGGRRDVGVFDAGVCGLGGGACTAPLSCECCPAGGPAQNCLCTQVCMEHGDCPDELPFCSQPADGVSGICIGGGVTCRWGSICASPDTLIATPVGERPIASLREGELVYSIDDEQTVAVPVLRATRVAVSAHRVVRIRFETGAVISMSAGHPTADGRAWGQLAVGDLVDGVRVVAVEVVAYEHEHTYDILPASSTGAYFAGGIAVGSTLR